MDDLFTSESVSEGHPDKLADQISDSILDAFLKEDSESRVACEVVLAKDHVIISGEVKSQAQCGCIRHSKRGHTAGRI